MEKGIHLGEGYRRYGDMVYKKLKQHGYSYVDFDMALADSELFTMDEKDLEQKILKEKELADDAGVKIWQVHGPWYPTHGAGDEEIQERIEVVKKSLRMTALLGCKNWVIHPIFPYGMEDKCTDDTEKTWNLNLSFMREVLRIAKGYGVTVCLENMPFKNFSISTPNEILQFVKEINDENFKICLDTGHVICLGESPAEAVRTLGNELRALHVHDSRVGLDLHSMPYFGICDWKDFADALKETGFSGVFSLETNPPSKLSDELFEKASLMLAEITDSIIKR